MKKEYRYIGKETKRILGDAIVTGRAQYTGDYRLPNMQYGKILRSPHPHARIKSIDTSRAKALEGISAVVTWKDIGRDIYVTNGFTPPKHHHILDEYVRYIGDAVALIVGVTEEVAEEAMGLIDVEYEVLKPVFTIDEAIAPGAPQLYPEFPGNIAPHKNNLNFEIGDVEAGFKEADAVVELDAKFDSGQNPLPLEPPTIIADWTGDTCNFIASAAAPAYCHQNVAASLNIPFEQIRLMSPAVGGSFGSKLYSGNVHCLVFTALMSKAAHCPVLYTYTKEEHFGAHQTRMNVQAHIKFGMKKDGTTTAVTVKQYGDAGNCASTQEFMLAVGTETPSLISKTGNQKYDAEVVLTNHIPSGSFRGYGYLESTNLITRAIFDACEQLDVDPAVFFEKNALKHGERYYNSTGAPHFWVENMGPNWDNLVRETAKAFRWNERWKGWGVPTWVSQDGKRARGVGVCAAGQSDTGGKPSNASVTITGLGSVFLGTCMADFGAGAREVMQKICAEELDVPLESIRLTPSDSGVAPPDFGSTGSRSTYCGGIAVKRACEDLKQKLFAMAEQRVGIQKDDCGFKDGFIYRLSNPEEKYPMFPKFMGKVDGVTGYGHFDGVHNSTIYHIQFLEIEVDKELGTFKIIDHFGGSDVGIIVNPLPLRNQLQSFYAGVDLATMEETVWDPNDFRVLNPSNIDYKTRMFNDVVPHDHLILESFKDKESDFPFGAFGAGEPALSPGGPAIRMALYNACGIKLDSYPFTPNKVLAALKAKEAK